MKYNNFPYHYYSKKMMEQWAQMNYQSYRFAGTDSRSFLQGQLTQDINEIKPGQCQYGAYCNHKGRMFANVLLHSDGEDIILRIHADQAERVMKRLTMFILRSKVIISKIDGVHIAMNAAMATLFCQHHSVNLPEEFKSVLIKDVTLCALPNGYYEAIIPKSSNCLAFFNTENRDQEAIEWLRLTGGHFHVLPETNEMLLPQQTPLETWGAINYTKGCYVGQEIIARNKYLGKVKKCIALAVFESVEKLALKTPVMQGDRTIGQVVDFTNYQGKTACLALVSLDTLSEAGTVNGVAVMFTPITSL